VVPNVPWIGAGVWIRAICYCMMSKLNSCQHWSQSQYLVSLGFLTVWVFFLCFTKLFLKCFSVSFRLWVWGFGVFLGLDGFFLGGGMLLSRSLKKEWTGPQVFTLLWGSTKSLDSCFLVVLTVPIWNSKVLLVFSCKRTCFWYSHFLVVELFENTI